MAMLMISHRESTIAMMDYKWVLKNNDALSVLEESSIGFVA